MCPYCNKKPVARNDNMCCRCRRLSLRNSVLATIAKQDAEESARTQRKYGGRRKNPNSWIGGS